MKIMNFKKVATSANDAAIEYFVPADRILAIQQTTADAVIVRLRAIDAEADDVKGDNITITATGKAEEVGDFIAQAMYGNMQTGPTPVIDAATLGGAISAQILTQVT